MILNSGRHTQPDPQSCRVRSLGGRRGGAQKQTTHQETKTKLSSANANTEKASRQQCRSGISTSPTPCCESLRQQHPNNSKQHGALAKFGNMQAGLETFNQQPCSPESCHSATLHLQKYCFLLKLRHFSQERSLQQSHFQGRKHIGFLDSKKWSSPVALKACCLNKTQL